MSEAVAARKIERPLEPSERIAEVCKGIVGEKLFIT